MTAASPLRGPQGHGRRRLRRRSSSGRAAQATGPLLRPPGRFAFPAEMAFRPPWTPETSAAPGAGRAGRRRACPGQARGAQARAGGQLQIAGRQEQSELAFDNQKKGRKNYTNPGPGTGSGSLITAEPPGEAASHRTRCAWNPGCSRLRVSPALTTWVMFVDLCVDHAGGRTAEVVAGANVRQALGS